MASNGLFGWIRRLFGATQPVVETAAPTASRDAPTASAPLAGGIRFVVRDGRSQEADTAFDAWTSGDLDQMMAAVDARTNAVDRHHLLNQLVEQTYRRRAEPGMTEQCSRFCTLYMDELPDLLPALRRNWRGTVPFIPAFTIYCKLLAARLDFDAAIIVCDQAIALGLRDGTKGGFEGRRDRLVKARAKSL